MKYCPNCKEYKDASDALFCNACGTRLIESDSFQTEALSQDAYFCPNCGNQNKRENKFCSKCGYALNSQTTENDVSPERKTGKKAIVILIVFILVLLGVLGLIGYKFIGVLVPNASKKQPADITAQAAVVSTAASTTTQNETESQQKSTRADPAASTTDTTTTENNDSAITIDTATEANVSVHTFRKPVIKTARTLSGAVLGSSSRDATRTFGADQAIDGKPETCWCVNTAQRGGAGAEIMITFETTAYVSGIRLINGNTYLPEENIYTNNGQIRVFTLEFSTGESQSYSAAFNSDGSATYQTIPLDEPVETSYIILRVDSGYVGESFPKNVCLGEFDVF